MTRTQLMQAVSNKERELADAGVDNRHVPRRKMASRWYHLGTHYLSEASFQKLGWFYLHLQLQGVK